MQSFKPIAVSWIAIVSLSWILLHLIYLYEYGKVIIYEFNPLILIVEIIMTVSFILFAIWTIVEYARDN